MKIGSISPNFKLPSDGGTDVQLSDFTGRKLVIFFYPRDNTSGCTTEAVEFSLATKDFAASDTAVIGVSKDSVKSHENFRDKHTLSVPLLSDKDGTMCQDFGVWQEKKLYGKTHMGIVRTTVLIDAQGIVRQVWQKVKVGGHVEAVLSTARSL